MAVLRPWFSSLLLGLLWLSAASLVQAANFSIINTNDPGVGFNDTTAVAPVTGNPATTLGAQRLAAFQAAADSWGHLISPVTIVISARMIAKTCTANSAVLGSAGALDAYRNFPGAPQNNVWYPVALANALAGSDLSPGDADIVAEFNKDIGTPGCLTNRPWSYVIGVAPPANTMSFYNTVIHEIGHGLGFASFASSATGQLFAGFSDSYTQHLLDETPTPTLWTALNDAGRQASATDTGNLTWNGSSVNAVAGLLTAGRHASNRVRMYAPSPLQQGSSVSHFDTALTPNEIMEPLLTNVTRQRLANHLMLDLGWRAQVNLQVSNSDGLVSLPAGSATSYNITVQNNSAADLTVINLGVLDTLPAALQGVSWSCSGLAGGICSAGNGVGNINTQVTVPAAGSVVFTINAVVNAAFTGSLSNTVNLVLPANLQNQNPSTLTATDVTSITAALDPAGISVSTISGDTSEAGAVATFEVVLDSEPAAGVSVDLSSNDASEGSISQSTLTFTAADWDSPQQVTVSGVDDDIDDGDVAWSIITAAAVSSDPDYQGLDPDNVVVINIDDDTAGIEVSAVSDNTMETGVTSVFATATFSIELDSEPTADVSISLSSSNDAEGLPSPGSVTFTPANWFEAKLVTITGQDDAVEDGDIGYSIITAPATSLDPNYSGLDPADVNLLNRDDENELVFKGGFESP
jgi:hypothetical protein